MHTINFSDKVDGKTQAVFVIFYALHGQPWKSYPADNSGRHSLIIPTFLMINRSDGAIGFIGGKVEGHETLEQAAIREVREEIGHSVTLDLVPLVAHDIGPITSHAFMCEMSYTDLRAMQNDAIHAEHFGSELTGVFLPHLIDYQKEVGRHGGVVNLLASAMAPSVREEIVHFFLHKHIFAQDHLSDLCEAAGYNLEDLLK